MKTTQKATPLGLILELLGLSVTTVSNQIQVERSLVSKWKSGSRTLQPNSQYFERLVEYLLQVNEEVDPQRLVNLMLSAYGIGCGADQSPEVLHKCLEQFLIGRSVPGVSQSLLHESNSKLYTAQISVLWGLGGRREAMEILLEVAEGLEQPTQILILERERFSWLMSDWAAVVQFRGRVLRLLDRGFQLKVLHLLPTGQADGQPHFEPFLHLMFYQNVQEYFTHCYDGGLPGLSYYLLQGHLAIVGAGPLEGEVYSGIYRDPIMIRQYDRMISAAIEGSTPFFSAYIPQEGRRLPEIFRLFGPVPEVLYFYNYSPGFVLMDESLLQEVLEENQVDAGLIQALQDYLRQIQGMLAKVPSRHIYCQPKMEEQASQPRIYYGALSTMVGRPIYLDAQQYRRHLQSVLQRLESYKELQVALIPSDVTAMDRRNFWCKEHQWVLLFEEERAPVQYCIEPVAIDYFTSQLRRRWELIPLKYRSRHYLCQTLHTILDVASPAKQSL